MSKVFLDIDIGDEKKFKEESDEYQRAVDFVKSVGSNYGLSTNSIDKLDETELESVMY